ncbi:MAG: EamA family transporter [Deltaproteobacteria bacterium CG2_30_63_29]|nr:MAG: EamA family transporter [Deltaproteobacteria bacterium CG2_30_63_29]
MSVTLRSTLVGASALLLWSTLAVLTGWAGPTPPFLLVGIAFLLAFAMGALRSLLRGESVLGPLRQPWRVWALGVGGLFGYHASMFFALQNAPPVEANLINYLWPLLIVLFSGFLPGHRLRAFHVGGAALGLLGVVILLSGKGAAPQATAFWGYGAAFLAAFIWASYSVLSRLFAAVPSEAVGGFCLVGSLLAFLCHAAFEPSVWPSGAGQWAAVVVLGLGPAGGAFFLWDVGMKKGDIQVLGVLSYTTALVSTLLLIVFGEAQASGSIAMACGLIVGGAVLASKELLGRAARA